MKDATQIFKRHEGGPLLYIKDLGKAQIIIPHQNSVTRLFY